MSTLTSKYICFFDIIMETFSSDQGFFHSQRFSAGAVGPIGDPNLNIRLRMSNSELGLRFNSNLNRGSTVNDGNNPLMYRPGANAKAKTDETHPRIPKKERGTRVFELVPSEMRVFDTKQISDPLQAWHDKRNSTFLDAGAAFGRSPNGFSLQPGQMPRGVLPRVVRIDPNQE